MKNFRRDVFRRRAITYTHHGIRVNAVEIGVVQLRKTARIALRRFDQLLLAVHCLYGYNRSDARKVTVVLVAATPDPPSKLLDYLDRAAQLDAEFIVYDDGYRGRSHSYREIAAMANTLRARLRAQGIRKGDRAMLWSESRAGWVAALWACLADGVILVPVDPQSSAQLFDRIAKKAGATIALIGDRQPEFETPIPVWKLSEIEDHHDPIRRSPDAPKPTASDIAEIVFTSGTTAEPKGVVITHANLLANLDPVAGEIAKYRKYAAPFQPLRILNLLPLSHLFGQSLALLIPPLDPDIGRLHRQHRRATKSRIRSRPGACRRWSRCRRSWKCCAIWSRIVFQK